MCDNRMKTGTVYTVCNEYGVDGLFTAEELITYCRDWWDDVAEYSDYPDHRDLNDEDVVLTYFDIQSEFGMGGYYAVFTVTEDMLDD